MPVTERRESGIEILDDDADTKEGVESEVFQTEEDVQIVFGETTQGRPIAGTADRFVAASVDTEINIDQTSAQMHGISVEDEGVVENEDGTLTRTVNESSVFIASDEGEVGYGLLTVEEGEIEDAILAFEEQYL